jgi:DNA-binding response OmpR family regulator
MRRADGNKNRLHDVTASIASQSADSKTILVVDDEPGIPEFIWRVLKPANYTVIPRLGGNDAWDILERGQSSVDLVLTDIVMPGPINGIVLANKIRRKYRKLPVVFMTGALPEKDKFVTAMARDRRLLRKPFSPKQLLEFVDSHLGKNELESGEQERDTLKSSVVSGP